MMKLENGIYIKANIIELLVSDREFVNKKTGETFRTYTLVVDEGGTSQKRFIRLNSKQIEKGLHEKLSNPSLKDKNVIIPVWLSSYNDRVNFNYAGDDLPLVATAAGATNAA